MLIILASSAEGRESLTFTKYGWCDGFLLSGYAEALRLESLFSCGSLTSVCRPLLADTKTAIAGWESREVRVVTVGMYMYKQTLRVKRDGLISPK